MARRFETTIGNQRLARQLEGLDPQAIRIARDPDMQRNLNDFMQSQVEPERLTFTIEGYGEHSFVQRHVSAVGSSGTLVHTRLHQAEATPWPEELTYALTVGSLHVSGAQPWTARAGLTHDYTDIRTFWIEADGITAPELVDDAMGEEDWVIEQLLEDEAEFAGLPRIETGPAGWNFRRPDGSIEPLRDLKELASRVDLAIARGLGKSALSPITDSILTLAPTGSDQ